ncbi:MAG: cytochrome P450 [Gemmatimonadaceae bacterium]
MTASFTAMAPREGYYDKSLRAWVLSRYAEVTSALHSPNVVPHGTTASSGEAHREVRAAAMHAFAAPRLSEWHSHFSIEACRFVAALPTNALVDLVEGFAEPWSLEVALTVTGASRSVASECRAAARELFLSSAHATDGAPQTTASNSATTLARLLARESPSSLADVQTFVALSQSLPALLAGAWLALLRNPSQMLWLREDFTRIETSVGELLRFASPARAIFREVVGDVVIGTSTLARRDRLVLLLAAANRDAERFVDPDSLDLRRDTSGHLTFGTGVHRCAGASLVRMSVAIATEALLEGTSGLDQTDDDATPIRWIDGFAVQAPSSLPVKIRRLTTSQEKVVDWRIA